ncbi:MAG: rhodanese-like domain-containing protein [Candidatus Caldarchaeum sp.]
MKSPIIPKLITPHNLLDNIDNYKIIDVRRLIEYRAGHIPNALPLPFSNFIKLVGVALYPAPAEELSATLSHIGVTEDDFIIFYDNFYGRHAARAAYTLELLGFRKLGLLSTTFDEYVKQNHPVTAQKQPLIQKTNLTLRYDEQSIITREKIIQLIQNSDEKTVIVDTRSPADYEFGHIPSAVNIPWHKIYSSTNLFNFEAIKQAAEEKQINPDVSVVFYCEEGTSSSFMMYGFRLAGFTKTHTYLPSYPGWLSMLKP